MQVIIMKTRELFKLYQQILTRRPYLVQAIQTGTLMGTGDIIAQTLIEKKQHIEWNRALRFSSIGFFIGGPALRIWYGKLNQHLGSTGKSTALKKVLVDQVIFAPAFLGTLLVVIGTMQGKTWDNVKQDVQINYLDILKSNYYVWPWVQILNFYYVPLQYQVLLVQTVALFWNTYLSWKINRIKDLDVD